MRKLTFALNSAFFTFCRSTVLILFVVTLSQSAWGQCIPQSNSIEGTIFEDIQNDGDFKSGDVGLANVKVTAYDTDGVSKGFSVSDINGEYSIENLTDGNSYRLVFESSGSFYPGIMGKDNRSSVQFVASPACEINYGLTRNGGGCSSNPNLALTCFVQGSVDENSNVESIISVEHGFAPNSAVSKNRHAWTDWRNLGDCS